MAGMGSFDKMREALGLLPPSPGGFSAGFGGAGGSTPAGLGVGFGDVSAGIGNAPPPRPPPGSGYSGPGIGPTMTAVSGGRTSPQAIPATPMPGTSGYRGTPMVTGTPQAPATVAAGATRRPALLTSDRREKTAVSGIGNDELLRRIVALEARLGKKK